MRGFQVSFLIFIVLHLVSNKNSLTQCVESVESCLVCQTKYMCLLCPSKSTKIVSGLSISCSPCPPNCVHCSSPTSCSQCETGYWLENGQCRCPEGRGLTPTDSKCKRCSDGNCKRCFHNYSNCTECIPGFSLQNGSCLACQQHNCDICFNASLCNLCKNGFGFVGAQCVTCQVQFCVQCTFSQNCVACAKGFDLAQDANNTAGLICVPCADNCLQCY